MATSAQTITGNITTDALFQDCMGKIRTNIQTFGWTQTADSGQTNPATATKPAANNYAGYEIYQTADALTPMYLKIRYGIDASSRPMVEFTLGTGTNGAGTLTGNVGSAVNCTQPNMGAGTVNLFMSGANNRLFIGIGSFAAGVSQGSWAISFGRVVDTTGAETSNGMEMFWSINTGANGQLYIPTVGSGVVPSAEGSGMRVIFTNAATGVIGGNTRFGHPITWGETITNNPTLCVAIYATNDISPGGSVTTTVLSIYGTNHTFICSAERQNNVGIMIGNSNARAAWRWE